MSAIAGLLQLDGAPADAALVGRMLDSMRHRGPDGYRVRASGAVALGYAALHTTPDAAGGQQPVVAGRDGGAVTIVFDGRLDNRDELLAALASHGVRVDPPVDAAIVLGAYERWGVECPERLLGDFAFAVWDARARRLFCARDIVGVRPLCYRATAKRVRVASEPQAVLIEPDAPIRLNEGMVAEHLAGIVTSRQETVVDGLLRLPPAHTLVAGPAGVVVRRYWDLDPGRRIRYRHDGEYEEHLREVFRDAVRCRLRATGRVGVMLSGGLDSSSIAGMAARLRRDEAGIPRIDTFSLVFPGRACDERPFADAVNRMWRFEGHAIVEPRIPWVEAAERAVRRYKDVPGTPSLTAAGEFVDAARASGVRVLLFGAGGDEWLRGSPSRYADLTRRLSLATLVRQVAADAGTADFVGWTRAARLAVWPLVPPPAQQLVKRLIRHDVIPPWIDPRFAARTDLRARLDAYRARLPFDSAAQADGYHEATSGQAVLAMEQLDRTVAALGMEPRHPFHDRRLIEVAFACPPDQHWRDGRPKSLARRAFADLLPPAVCARTGRPDYSHLIADALAAHGRAGLLSLRASAARGWLAPERARREFERTTAALAGGGPRAWRWAWPLWGVCAVECWARVGLQPA